jgi:ribose transport system substrate-binding protein
MKHFYSRSVMVLLMMLMMQAMVLSQQNLKIAVIPKSNNALFWKSVHLGAKLGATALSGIEILWNAPQAEDNTSEQVTIVEQCIKDNVSGIILSPINQDALVASVAKAMSKKIPVIIFDSALKGVPGKNFVSFVGINNKKAGALAGEHLATLIKPSGKVVLLRYIKGQANTTEREEGFLEAMAKHSGIQVLVKDVYSGGSVNEAKDASMGLINKLREADGVFCPNEQSTIGMLLALQEAKLAGKIKFVGFDTPVPVVDALKKGEVHALVAQDPARIGFQSVKSAVDYIRGKKVPANIDIDVKVVTRENFNNPDIKKLLTLPGISE